ncbi:MAG: hypothetical protein ACI81R_002271 [Bradymonadia bacterium]|jgi:hypothetical protein
MGTMQWLSHFERSLARTRELPWQDGVNLAPALRTPVLASLGSIQRGLTSPGIHLRTKVRAQCTEEYARCIDLYVNEKTVHSELLMRLLWDAKSAPKKRALVDFAFRRLRRRSDWAWEIMVLLTAEMASAPFLRVISNTVDDPLTRSVLETIIDDQAFHLGFHIDHLRPAMEERDNMERLALQQAWGAFFTTALSVVLIDNRETFAALKYDKLAFWTDAWNLFAQVQTGLNGSQHLAALLGKDPRLKFVV